MRLAESLNAFKQTSSNCNLNKECNREMSFTFHSLSSWIFMSQELQSNVTDQLEIAENSSSHVVTDLPILRESRFLYSPMIKGRSWTYVGNFVSQQNTCNFLSFSVFLQMCNFLPQINFMSLFHLCFILSFADR